MERHALEPGCITLFTCRYKLHWFFKIYKRLLILSFSTFFYSWKMCNCGWFDSLWVLVVRAVNF